MKIFIDTNTFADAPAVYADAEKTQALPRVLPLVQGFKGELAVGFLGDRAPSQSARAIFAARPLGSKTDVVQTEPGVIRVEGEATVIRFNITADTTQLAEALGDAESLAVRAGIVVEEEALCKPARSEWQLTFSVSATALGGDQPDPRPSEADELRSEIAAEAACRAAADAELAAELRADIAAEAACRAAADAELASGLRADIAAESACRKSELLRVDSKFSELTDALDAEEVARKKSVDAEAACRAAADAELASELRADIAAESACRKSEILRVDSNFSELSEALDAEAACRAAADAELAAELRADIAAEAACRVAADAALCARICAIEISAGGGISAACVDAKIAEEAACRSAADAELLDALDAEAACRKSEILRVDSNFSELSDALDAEEVARKKSVGAEAACRSAADAALCARICKIEKCGASSACGLPGVCVDARIEKAVTSEAACRAAADAALQANIDALDASFGAALCAQNSELREWAGATFVCRGGGLVVGYGARLEFADSEGATAAAMRFTDSPSGGVLSVGSASTDAAMTWMSGNYMSWFSPEFLRLYSGACVVSPTAKIEANPNGVILAAGAGDAAKIVVDAGKIQVSGAPLTLNVAPTAANHAATKGYVDAADAALCARICKIEKCGASSACGLPSACVDARIEKAVTSEAACRSAADAELLDALDAEAACRKSEILRVDSNFSELSDALDAEEVARKKSVGAEAACRTAADACLRRCIGARDSAVRALCGTVSSLRTCVNAINTNVACVYPQIPKICSKLTMISACASRLDSRVEALEDAELKPAFVSLSQAEYDALPNKDADTLYVITD